MADKPVVYEPHPVSAARKAELVAQGYRIVDAIFAPPGVVRPVTEKGKLLDAGDPASLAASKGPGGRWFVKRGNEIVTGPFETEADAKKAAGIEGGKIDLGTDSADQFSDEQLRAAIEAATGEKVHHKTGREKLIARFNEINAENAARQDEKAANGLTRREIEADLEGEGIEFDPREGVEDLLALRDMAREEQGE